MGCVSHPDYVLVYLYYKTIIEVFVHNLDYKQILSSEMNEIQVEKIYCHFLHTSLSVTSPNCAIISLNVTLTSVFM
jgi:hypothetical protein